jgi:transcriptional regulator with XRE-family HTH domain
MEKLKEFRKKLGISQEAMAKKLGITLSMYEKVEQGRANASAGFMKRFKSAFSDASVDDIFFADEQQQNCCTR